MGTGKRSTTQDPIQPVACNWQLDMVVKDSETNVNEKALRGDANTAHWL